MRTLTNQEKKKVARAEEAAEAITKLEQRWGSEDKCKHEWKVSSSIDWEGVLTIGVRCKKCGEEVA